MDALHFRVRIAGQGPKDIGSDLAFFGLFLRFAFSLVLAMKHATSIVPIVAMTSVPVGHCIAASIARPGGNITGVTVDPGLELWTKRIELLREVAPKISKLGILGTRANPEAAAMRDAADKARITVVGSSYVDNGSEEEYRSLFATISVTGTDALFVDGSPEHITKRQLIVELAAKSRLPTIYPFRSFVEAGGLVAYGIDLVEIFRRAAGAIDQVLKGSRPADIPFYQPTKFELVINRAAGKEIGVVFSEQLLARADEVIE